MSTPQKEEKMIAEEDHKNKEEDQINNIKEDQSKKMEEEIPISNGNKTQENSSKQAEPEVKHVVAPAVVKTVVEANQEQKQQQQQLTKVYNFGSNEMDQFWLPDQRSETRRPYLNSALNNQIVVQIACGSLHALILTNQGIVFTQGQNDDGALGRPDESATDEESDKKSKPIDIPIKVDMISAGDSHSVAANSELGICFQWGTYRNTEKANLAEPAKAPVRVGAKEFYRKKFTKILSGQQHSLVLTDDGELFGWGDPDMGVIGRISKTRHGYEQALKIAKITAHKVADIYTGGRHSFMKRLIKNATPATDDVPEQKAVYAYYSWGLNNFGQLGLDLPEEKHLDVVCEPTQIKFFDNMDVKEFCGGESHSLALLEDGTVYAFGRNDIGQFALGKVKEVHPVYKELEEKNPKPLKIDTFPSDTKKITNIWAGANYSYAKDETGQVYSWGFGSNFVLGNRKDEDEDEYKPYVIPRDFFKNEIPFNFALGTQHVSYYVNLAEDGKKHTVPKELLIDAPDEYLPFNMRKKPSPSKIAKEKEEREAKKAEENAKRKEAQAAKKQEEADKKAEKEKERLAKKEEKEIEEDKKKREKSVQKKGDEKKSESQKKTDDKKKNDEKGNKKRSVSASKQNGKNKSESKSRSKSKSKPKTTANTSASQKSRSKSNEKTQKAVPAKKPAASPAKAKSNGSSNKKKPALEDQALASQAKNTMKLKKEQPAKKK